MLAIQDLTIGYQTGKRNTVVASQLHMKAHLGELISIIGRNGSGKTTLIKTLAQLLPALDGSIHWEEMSLEQISLQKKAQLISYVGQFSNIPLQLQVGDALALGRNPYTNWLGKLQTSDRLKIEEVAAQLDLTNWLNTPLHQLSSGQRQRCMIGLALVQDTPIILLDEPSVFLDLDHKAHIFGLLKTIAQQQQKLVLICTHDLNPALQISDRVMVLNQKKGHYGTPRELVDREILQHLFPQEWVGFDPRSLQFSICV